MYSQSPSASDTQRQQGSEFGEFGSWQHRVQQPSILDTGPSDDILDMISNDSPVGLPQGLWARPESRSAPGPAALPQGHVHGNGYGGPSVCANGHSYSGGTGVNSCSTSAGQTASTCSDVLSAPGVLPLPGGKSVAELLRGLSALSAHSPAPSMGYGAEHVLRATTSVERRTGLMAQQPQPQHPSGLSMLGGELPGAQLPLPTPLPTTQQPLHHRHVAPLPAQHALHPKPQPVSPVRQAQQQQEQQMHAEMARLRQALADRVDEVSRLNTQASKLSKVREQDMEKLKNSLIRDREEKLAKQSAAHNKRLVAKEEEMAALKASMTKEKDKELAKAAATQQKALRAKDEEAASMCAGLARERDERVARLSAALKDVKGEISQRDEQLSALRKALASSEKAAEEARRAHAAAAAGWKSLKTAHDAELAQAGAARTRSPSPEQTQMSEKVVRQLTAEAESKVAARVAELESALARAEARAAGLSAELARGRGVVQQVVLDAHVMAETSISISTQQQELLVEKARQHVEDVTAEELHWLMTAPFRAWLEQSYTECDEVCDVLETEQQRLKRLAQSNELELGKMRTMLAGARSHLSRAYHILVFSVLLSLLTAVAGAWRVHTTADFHSSLQEMGSAWLLIVCGIAVSLYDSGRPSHPNLSTCRDLRRGSRGRARSDCGRRTSNSDGDGSGGRCAGEAGIKGSLRSA